jgi:5-formyltetrahydrofolate cyclo-ligase
MNKSELRTAYLSQREKLSQEELEQISTKVLNNIIQTIDLKKKIISLFLSIKSKKELNTDTILKHLIKNNNKVVVSKSNFKETTLDLFLYENENQLVVSKFGVPEPSYGEVVNPKEIDIVFVPLLCFDSRGYRVGYGKGFYDRFLACCRKDCLKIGLSIFDEPSPQIDINEFDIPLDMCITPNKIFKFSSL